MTVPVKPRLCQNERQSECLDFGIPILDMADTQQSGAARFSFSCSSSFSPSSQKITSIFLSQSIARPTKGVRSRLPVTHSSPVKQTKTIFGHLFSIHKSVSVRLLVGRRASKSLHINIYLPDWPKSRPSTSLRTRLEAVFETALRRETRLIYSVLRLPLFSLTISSVTQKREVGSCACGAQKVRQTSERDAGGHMYPSEKRLNRSESSQLAQVYSSSSCSSSDAPGKEPKKKKQKIVRSIDFKNSAT